QPGAGGGGRGRRPRAGAAARWHHHRHAGGLRGPGPRCGAHPGRAPRGHPAGGARRRGAARHGARGGAPRRPHARARGAVGRHPAHRRGPRRFPRPPRRARRPVGERRGSPPVRRRRHGLPRRGGVNARVLPAGRPTGWQRWSGLLFTVPYLIVFVLMLVVPLAIGIRLSLMHGDLFGMKAFVGFDNFARLARDPVFRQTVWNTFYFVLLTVPAMTLLGLALALVLNQQTRWAAALRAIFFASTVLSVTVVTLIWRLVLVPEGGLAAVIAKALGQEPVAFLNEQALALPSIAVTTIWWGIGLPMVLFLAALQQVPRELYEAAALDNASRLR